MTRTNGVEYAEPTRAVVAAALRSGNDKTLTSADDAVSSTIATASLEAVVFPGESWESRTPERMQLEAGILDQLATTLGGRGCVIRHGYVVKSWGDQSERGDWASSARPVLSTLLFYAVEEGLVKSVDQIGPASICLPPDIQDAEHPHEVREALWGNLIAGGSGTEWIVAYDTWPRQPGKHLDIACENSQLVLHRPIQTKPGSHSCERTPESRGFVIGNEHISCRIVPRTKNSVGVL